MGTALVLAGHGSHISPHTAGLVWRYVDNLRARGVADEITACFWKETPSFHEALNTVTAEHVVIVPVFTAQGYFSRTVIPAEMGLVGSITRRDGRTIYYTDTIGQHSMLSDIVRQRVEAVLNADNLNPADVTVAVIGHGTKRSDQSRDAARRQAHLLREVSIVAQVEDVYLDDDPAIPTIYETARTRNIIAVPYFLAPGSHVTIDVPDALGITAGDTPIEVDGHTVYYTAPVGTDDVICEIILDLARETGIAFPERKPVSSWQCFPKAGAETFMNAVNAGDVVEFGELLVTEGEVKPHATAQPVEVINNPVRLREKVRENPFRPLATIRDLPDDWCVPVGNTEDIHAIVETVYPGAAADWAAQQSGDFEPESLEVTSERQTGLFRGIHAISAERIRETIEAVCGKCIRHPTWFDTLISEGTIPCKAACNVWLSAVRES